MSETRNHPTPDHVDPFDLPDRLDDEAAPVDARPQGDRVRLRKWPRQAQEKRRHAG
jgi:hypothetical protein